MPRRNRQPSEFNPTHAQLIEVARHWLQNHYYRVVITATEMVTGAYETPDLIGFHTGGASTVIEVKTSRADFHRDKKKLHRRTGTSLGSFRYYLAPAGTIEPSDLPEDHGLILAYPPTRRSGGRLFVRQRVKAPRRETTIPRLRAERLFLVSVARRALGALSMVKPLSIPPPVIEGRKVKRTL